ncbi:mitochondrial large subunit ribosomal protein-domain-containing protein [Cladochytrium replicatum]|nr:mitochondrial large subunit ribosomal protein-domain-containing protein [Cladochytrium replicatum]
MLQTLRNALPAIRTSQPFVCGALPAALEQRRYRSRIIGQVPVPYKTKTILLKDPSEDLTATDIETKETLPYNVKRTMNGWLPVYDDIRGGGSRVQTIIRRIEGDVQRLVKDLSAYIPHERIHIKTTNGHVVLDGYYVDKLRDFFTARKF